MERVYNFAAGPAAMPLEALETAAREMTCFGSTGMSAIARKCICPSMKRRWRW